MSRRRQIECERVTLKEQEQETTREEGFDSTKKSRFKLLELQRPVLVVGLGLRGGAVNRINQD